MKLFALLFLMVSIGSCDPYSFGYKKNPAYILSESFKALNNLDVESFLEVSGKEVLCLYANHDGLAYLKEKLVFNVENIEIDPKVLTEKRLKIPHFVGYWSYYNERYIVNINNKETKKTLFQAVIDCDFGSETKEEQFSKPEFNIKKHKIKRCDLVKIISNKFQPLPIQEKCNQLKVTLD